MDLEGGLWTPCGRNCVWLVAVSLVQGWVHCRCSVDGELGKKKDRGRGQDTWASPTRPRVTHCMEQLLGGFQVSPIAALASASLLSQPQAAAGGEGNVLLLIVLAVLGGFLTPHRIEGAGAGNPICSL